MRSTCYLVDDMDECLSAMNFIRAAYPLVTIDHLVPYPQSASSIWMVVSVPIGLDVDDFVKRLDEHCEQHFDTRLEQERRFVDGTMAADTEVPAFPEGPNVPSEQLRIRRALARILQHGSVDGSHHKQWVLDQVVRILCGNELNYERWVAAQNAGEDGPQTYTWDEGIAP